MLKDASLEKVDLSTVKTGFVALSYLINYYLICLPFLKATVSFLFLLGENGNSAQSQVRTVKFFLVNSV